PRAEGLALRHAPDAHLLHREARRARRRGERALRPRAEGQDQGGAAPDVRPQGRGAIPSRSRGAQDHGIHRPSSLGPLLPRRAARTSLTLPTTFSRKEARMRLRMYVMLPDVASAHKVANDLLLARVEDKHMHFLARRGTDLGELHEASYLQKTDTIYGAFRGLIVGGGMGVLLGLLLVTFPPPGIQV